MVELLQVPSPMMTIAECLQMSQSLATLSDSPRLDTELLLANVLQKTRTHLYTYPESRLTDIQWQAFQEALERRVGGEPVAHIVGHREFWSLDLKVDNSTLIPRPETELLVELTLAAGDSLSQKKTAPLRVLDLGTGTGAIALAVAKERPQWSITAVDKAVNAVQLAEENCCDAKLGNVTVACSDWFSALSGQLFDIVIANPPYIDANDPHLLQGDVRFEPKRALVANEQGLADLRYITETAPGFLSEGGWLLLEHGYNQASDVRSLFAAKNFSAIETVPDLAGVDRVTKGCITDDE